jgi:hypothetical protein
MPEAGRQAPPPAATPVTRRAVVTNDSPGSYGKNSLSGIGAWHAEGQGVRIPLAPPIFGRRFGRSGPSQEPSHSESARDRVDAALRRRRRRRGPRRRPGRRHHRAAGPGGLAGRDARHRPQGAPAPRRPAPAHRHRRPPVHRLRDRREARPWSSATGSAPGARTGSAARRTPGCGTSPLKGFAQNQVWCEIVALACELLAWTQLLALTGTARRWEPKRLRLRLLSAACGSDSPTMAPGPRAQRRHPPADPPVRLSSRNSHYDQERTTPGARGTPPTRRDSRTAGHGLHLKQSTSRTPRPPRQGRVGSGTGAVARWL